MSGRLPLSRFAHARARAPAHWGFAAAMGWMPLNDTEFHLTAHHLPLSVRLLADGPRLGCLVHPEFPARPPVDEAGRWRAGYMPIALRTFPFLLAREGGPRPIDDLDVFAASGLLGNEGVPICKDPATGELGPELMAIRNTLLMLRAGGARMTRALDLLHIAGLLAPLRAADGSDTPDLTLDPRRFGALDAPTVAALAHESFLPLDLAGALLFSRRLLHVDRLPAPRAESAEAAPAIGPQADPMDFVLAGLQSMNFALDGSDLIDLDGLVGDVPAQAEADKVAAERAVA